MQCREYNYRLSWATLDTSIRASGSRCKIQLTLFLLDDEIQEAKTTEEEDAGQWCVICCLHSWKRIRLCLGYMRGIRRIFQMCSCPKQCPVTVVPSMKPT